MRRPKMTSPHAILFLIAGIVNNIALSSPQTANRTEPPVLTTIPETGFSCLERPAGYYSDLKAGCQVYHMCDISQKKASFLCPGYTLFNQKFMVCDHWHAVDCSAAEDFYDLNLQIGQVPGNENEISDEEPKKSKFSSRRPNNTKATTPIKPFDRILTTTQTPFSSTTFRSFGRNITNTSPPSINPAFKRDFLRTTTFRPTTSVAITRSPTLPPNAFTTTLRRQQSIPPQAVGFQFISGRGSGRRVKFQQNNIASDEDTSFVIENLRPLFKNRLLDKRNFTVSNEIFTTTPIPDVSLEDIPVRNKEIGVISTFLLPPTIDNSGSIRKANRTAIVSPFSVQSPLKSPVILHGQNQEIFTPLFLSTRIEPPKRDIIILSPLPRITPPQFPFQKGNRDFFIPSPGLTPPLATNDLDELRPDFDDDDHDPHHRMTMTFPSAGSFRRGRPFDLKLNPKCPQCHPAFLVRECQPCVIIKR